jgi:hypothetical protein
MLALRDFPNAVGIASNSDQMRLLVGEQVLASPAFVWARPLTTLIQAELDGELRSGTFINGAIAEGFTDVVGISSMVPPSALQIVARERAKLQLSHGNEQIFCGPLVDNTGLTRVPPGTCLDRVGLSKMTWFVEGIVLRSLFVAPLPVVETHPLSLEIIVVVDILAAVVLCFGLFCAAYCVYMRAHPLIKASSYLFCALIGVGGAMNVSTTFLFAMDESLLGSNEKASAVCQLAPWWLLLSFVVVLGSLVVKL